MLTSRGCPFRCSYCYHPWRGRVNFRSAQNVIDEMLLMYHDHNVRHFAIKDDSFTAKRSHVESFVTLLTGKAQNQLGLHDQAKYHRQEPS